jgi:hypothetical protein
VSRPYCVGERWDLLELSRVRLKNGASRTRVTHTLSLCVKHIKAMGHS